MKKSNSILVYNAICSGVNTIDIISKKCNLGKMTVSDITAELLKRNIIEYTTPRQPTKGRRTHVFNVSERFFTVLIDIQKSYLSAIGISCLGKAVLRFDYPKDYENRDLSNILNLLLSKIKKHENYSYCLGIYLIDNKNELRNIPTDITKISKSELIASSFSKNDSLILFDINGESIVSVNGRLQFSQGTVEELTSLIKFDDIYTFEGDLYFQLFDALRIISIKNLEKLI